MTTDFANNIEKLLEQAGFEVMDRLRLPDNETEIVAVRGGFTVDVLAIEKDTASCWVNYADTPLFFKSKLSLTEIAAVAQDYAST